MPHRPVSAMPCPSCPKVALDFWIWHVRLEMVFMLTLVFQLPPRPCFSVALRPCQNQFQRTGLHDTSNKSNLQVAHTRQCASTVRRCMNLEQLPSWVICRSLSSSSEQRTALYTEADHLSTFSQIEAVDFNTTHTVSSIRFTPYPAGHVLGAAMFLIEIAGLKILFTGDYSREDDRHLVSAQVPQGIKIDVLITESTYGISTHIPRAERETALMKSVTGILNRGGRVLMPVFALGRAQELLLILDDYWARHAEFQRIPIYYASNLARKCMVVYQTYVSAMNDNIKRLFRERMAEAEQAGDTERGGPWDFRFVRSLKNLERFDDVGGCVVLASPGMLQSGISRELLERWAPSDRNGVVITGYSVEGTMAKQMSHEPDSIPAIMTNRSAAPVGRRGPGVNGEAEKPMIPRRCSVQEFSFAAHVDGQENQSFIEEVAAPVVVSCMIYPMLINCVDEPCRY